MEKQQIIERLKKLKALKDRGEGGEAVNAERMFADLCKKYNISPDIFDEEDEPSDHAVVGGNKEYIEILSQIVWKRVGREDNRVRVLSQEKLKHIKKAELKMLDDLYGVKGWDVLINCTSAEFVQVMFEWEILKSNYDERKKAFMYAFLDRNDLLLEATDENERQRVGSEEHKKIAMEAVRYSAFMEKANVHKAIDSGN